MGSNVAYYDRIIIGSGQNIAIGVASVQSAAVGLATFAVRVSALGNCHIRIDTNPTAVATDFLLKASDPGVTLGIRPGEKIAVIQDGAGTGNLNIVELTH